MIEGNQNMLPKVSVFVLVYQQAHFIRETLDSVLAQGYPNLEIVVGDDGSTDGTQDILREYDEKYPGLFKLLLSPVNVGITLNSNKILALCSGDYIALLGGDDLWLPGKLHKQIEWFANNPDAAICHTKTEEFESSTGAILSFTPERATPRNSPAGLGEFLRKPPVYVGSSFLIPRWAVPAAGFDERVKWVSDWLFLLDVLSKGRMGYIDEVLTRYRRHGDNVTSKINAMFLDVMRACDIAEEKYPDHIKDIKLFRLDWLLVYMHSQRVWGVLLPRVVMKGMEILLRKIRTKKIKPSI